MIDFSKKNKCSNFPVTLPKTNTQNTPLKWWPHRLPTIIWPSPRLRFQKIWNRWTMTICWRTWMTKRVGFPISHGGWCWLGGCIWWKHRWFSGGRMSCFSWSKLVKQGRQTSGICECLVKQCWGWYVRLGHGVVSVLKGWTGDEIEGPYNLPSNRGGQHVNSFPPTLHLRKLRWNPENWWFALFAGKVCIVCRGAGIFRLCQFSGVYTYKDVSYFYLPRKKNNTAVAIQFSQLLPLNQGGDEPRKASFFPTQ